MRKGLAKSEYERYSRQIIIPGFGEKGQRKLKESHAVVAGLGGLGSPVALYLVAAGIGRLTILDSGKVRLNNLNRQILYGYPNIGHSKAVSASERLSSLNPDVEIESRLERLNPKVLEDVLGDADVVIDGMDNYPARYMINEACVQKRVPFIHGAIEGFFGQLSTIIPRKAPCLKCIVPEEPPRKKTFPVLGVIPGVMGCLEAVEAIKVVTGIGKPLVGRMLLFNGMDMTFDEIKVNRDPSCQVCGRQSR